jgi:soluble lytic murein transglycosylase-like protein
MDLFYSGYDATFKTAVANYYPALDWRLLKSQAFQESRFKADAVSPVGAQGVMQIMPGTWSDLVSRGQASGDPFNAVDSIYAGVQYLKAMVDQWTAPRPDMDRLALALASYNAGLGNLLKAQTNQGNPALYADIVKGLQDVTGPANSNETRTYVQLILSYYNRLITGR